MNYSECILLLDEAKKLNMEVDQRYRTWEDLWREVEVEKMKFAHYRDKKKVQASILRCLSSKLTDRTNCLHSCGVEVCKKIENLMNEEWGWVEYDYNKRK